VTEPTDVTDDPSDVTRPRRSIDADIDYFSNRFRPRGHTVRNRWDMQSGWRMTTPPESRSSLRVSDAERNEVAERLSAHFADGRLDQSEFKDRLDAAMGAKTQGDLAGLFDDLPPLPTAEPAKGDDRHRRRRRSVPVLAGIFLVALIGLASVPPVHWFHVPWLLIGILAFFFWSRVVVRHRHDWHHH
jgi:Domain of unknown function (DUF1707)